MQYKILPSVKLQDKTTPNWAKKFLTGFILFERTPFYYSSNPAGENMGSGRLG